MTFDEYINPKLADIEKQSIKDTIAGLKSLVANPDDVSKDETKLSAAINIAKILMGGKGIKRNDTVIPPEQIWTAVNNAPPAQLNFLSKPRTEKDAVAAMVKKLQKAAPKTDVLAIDSLLDDNPAAPVADNKGNTDHDAQKAEESKKAEDARKAAEEAKKAEDARKAAEEAKKVEDARKAAEEAKKAEDARKAAEEAKKVEDAQKAAEEAKKAEDARKAAEEAKKAEDARKAAEEARKAEEAKKAEEAEKPTDFDPLGVWDPLEDPDLNIDDTAHASTKVDETHVEEKPAEETHVDETHVEETHVEETPSEETPIASQQTEDIPQQNDEPDIPDTADPRDEFSDLYDEIDNLSISAEQAEEAKKYADLVLTEPNDYPREYAILSGGASANRTKCVKAMLTTANKRIGYKAPVSSRGDDKLDFQSGVVSQSKGRPRVGASLVMPSGFGLKKNAAIWNTPVITDFGYPFLNFSSEAMLSVIKSKKDDEELKNSNLKKMFKEAAKRYGGIWKAIYSSPLTLIRQIASDVGIKCTPKYLKVNGVDLLNSDSGENVTVIPIKYYSIDPEFEGFINVPRDFLTTFYDVIDYSSTSKRMYLKYAQGMSEDEFAEEISENRGVPPFYILVPKQAKFSKCHIRSGSLLGSLMNVILGRKKCTMVKTVFQGKRGCLAMETDTANTLYADI